jgi:hypothetical protein
MHTQKLWISQLAFYSFIMKERKHSEAADTKSATEISSDLEVAFRQDQAYALLRSLASVSLDLHWNPAIIQRLLYQAYDDERQARGMSLGAASRALGISPQSLSAARSTSNKRLSQLQEGERGKLRYETVLREIHESIRGFCRDTWRTDMEIAAHLQKQGFSEMTKKPQDVRHECNYLFHRTILERRANRDRRVKEGTKYRYRRNRASTAELIATPAPTWGSSRIQRADLRLEALFRASHEARGKGNDRGFAAHFVVRKTDIVALTRYIADLPPQLVTNIEQVPSGDDNAIVVVASAPIPEERMQRFTDRGDGTRPGAPAPKRDRAEQHS